MDGNAIDLEHVVIAFDPGQHTGVAVFRDGKFDECCTLAAPSFAERSQLWHPIYATLLDQLHPYAEYVIVIEDYRTAVAPTKDGILAMRVQGFIEGQAAIFGIPIEYQMPSARVAFLDRARTLVGKSATAHARDATAHALAYLERLKTRGVYDPATA